MGNNSIIYATGARIISKSLKNNSRRFLAVTVAAMMFMGFSPSVFADSISPDSVMLELGTGETEDIRKRVIITEGLPGSSKVDVCFLTDSTGSMGGLIAAVKASASDILDSIELLGDVEFCVGEYKDFTDAFAYRENTALTPSKAAAIAGIALWGASGGGDFAEANLFGLTRMAEDILWRTDSTRIIIWFGDAPGHDPSGGATEASTIAALLAEFIVTQALDLGSLDSTGQATAITDATGGTLFAGINTGDIVTEIEKAIMAAFMEYSKVELMAICDPNLSVTFTPANYMGDFDRSIDRTFDFTEHIEALIGGDFHCIVNVLVDRGLVATQEIWNGDMSAIGGTFIPIDSTALLVAGAQSMMSWMIPVLVAGIGISLVLIRRR